MTTYSRTGYRWSVNEVLSLQREYELLGLSVDQIAEKHKRTPSAIMYKLDQEGFADYNVLYSNYYDLNAPISATKNSSIFENTHDDNDDSDNDSDYVDNEEESDDEDDDIEENTLVERVEFLEESITEIKDMLRQMMNAVKTTNPVSAYQVY